MISPESLLSGIKKHILVSLLCMLASCGLSDPTIVDITSCAFLSDNRHYLYEQRSIVTIGSTALSGYTYAMDLHYVDMVTGMDSIISSRKENIILFQHVNPSDSTFTMLNSDSVFVCMKDNLSAVIERPPHRYMLGKGTVAVDYYEHLFSGFDMTDMKTGLPIAKPEGSLLAPHDCGILACKGYYDSIMVLELSGKIRTIIPGQKRYQQILAAVYAGNNQFAYTTLDSVLHFVDAHDLHETAIIKLPKEPDHISISPDRKTLMWIGSYPTTLNFMKLEL